MDDAKRQLKGSERRDIFKQKHKELNSRFYATDADFCLISKEPPGTVAYLDYKGPGDRVTFTEAIQYNEWMKQAPVYIIEGDNPKTGPFRIRRYLGADWKPEPPKVNYQDEMIAKDWQELGEWESELRQEYHRRKGWNGKLRELEVTP